MRSLFRSRASLLHYTNKLSDEGSNVGWWTRDGQVNGVASARARHVIDLEPEVEYVAVKHWCDLSHHHRSAAIADQEMDVGGCAWCWWPLSRLRVHREACLPGARPRGGSIACGATDVDRSGRRPTNTRPVPKLV